LERSKNFVLGGLIAREGLEFPTEDIIAEARAKIEIADQLCCEVEDCEDDPGLGQ
jgi:hypothetical protein